jgi:hypothetical protein
MVSADAVSGESAVVEKKIAARIPWRTGGMVKAPCATEDENVVNRPSVGRFLMLVERSQPGSIKRLSIQAASDDPKALISIAPESAISSFQWTCLREVKKSMKPSDETEEMVPDGSPLKRKKEPSPAGARRETGDDDWEQGGGRQ